MSAERHTGTVAGTIPEAIAAMRDLGSALPPEDGVGFFNDMYLQVTEAVACRLDAGMFADPEFMDRLDVNFANLYLDAYARHSTPGAEPVCASWRALFDRRADEGILPLQYALAGMNAHINHDLPLAVTMTAAELDRPPTAVGVREDFVAVNAVLSEADDAVRAGLQGAVMSALDEVAGPLDDALGAWGIAQAREGAWKRALRLWQLLDDRPRHDRFLRIVDRLVALAGTFLLTPIGAGDANHKLLKPVFAAIDGLGERTADALWGDGVIDGEDDGIIGTVVWAARSLTGDLDGDGVEESLLAETVGSVLSRLGLRGPQPA